MKYFQVPTIEAVKILFPESSSAKVQLTEAVSSESSQESTTSLESSRSTSPMSEVLSQSPTSVASPRALSPESPITRMLSKLSLFRSRSASESSGSLTSQDTALPSARDATELDDVMMTDLNRGMVMGESYSQYKRREENPYALRLQSEDYFKDVFKRHDQEYPYIQGMISGTILDSVFHQDKGLYRESFERQRLDKYLLQKVSMVYQSDEGQWMGLNLACHLHTGEWYATVSDFSQEPAQLTIIGNGVYYNHLKTKFVSQIQSEPHDLGDIIKNRSLLGQLRQFEVNVFQRTQKESSPTRTQKLLEKCFLPFVEKTLGINFAKEKKASYKASVKNNEDFQGLIQELSATSSSPQPGRR